MSVWLLYGLVREGLVGYSWNSGTRLGAPQPPLLFTWDLLHVNTQPVGAKL